MMAENRSRKDEKVKVIVKQDCSVWINGKERKFKEGEHVVEKDIARILVEAGYAVKVGEK